MSGVWYEYQDENGNTYFYNTETEEYVWELPEGATIAPTDAAATTETTETSSDQQKMEFLKAAIEGKISKLDPDVKKKLEMAKQQQLELKKKKDEAVAAGQEDWVEVYDPNSDAFYYYEIVSGNVVWEKPTSYVMAADNELIAAVIKIQCPYRTRLARHRVKSIKDDPTPLRSITDINGNHWKEQKDSSGTIYYLNDVTGESQWDPPKEAEKLDEVSTIKIKINQCLCSRTHRNGIAKQLKALAFITIESLVNVLLNSLLNLMEIWLFNLQ